MKIDAFSIKGVRENNQDAYMVGVSDGEMLSISLFHHGKLEQFELDTALPAGAEIALVADGMGGLANGEQASYLTSMKFIDFLEDYFDPIDDISEILEVAIKELSSNVAAGAPEAGSTIVGVLLLQDGCWMFNVGDSKCILFTGEEIIRSKDHTFGEEMRSSIITDYIGMEGTPDVHVVTLPVPKCGILFSDGLNPAFTKYGEQICETQMTAESLVNEAVSLGSDDNVTCILLRNGSGVIANGVVR